MMLPAQRTVGALMAHLAQTIPQQEAVVFPPQRLTYAALYAQATAVASGLWHLGIRPREPVALLVSNRPEWLTTALGCALIGAPVVAISTWSRRIEKVQYAAVVGLLDTLKGEAPVAAVALRDGEVATSEEIRSFCRDHIASYKIPVHVILLPLDEFPRTSTGKVQKTGLCAVIAARLGSSATPTQQEGSDE